MQLIEDCNNRYYQYFITNLIVYILFKVQNAERLAISVYVGSEGGWCKMIIHVVRIVHRLHGTVHIDFGLKHPE